MRAARAKRPRQQKTKPKPLIGFHSAEYAFEKGVSGMIRYKHSLIGSFTNLQDFFAQQHEIGERISLLRGIAQKRGGVIRPHEVKALAAGVFTKELLPKNYTVTLENPPEGYSCPTSFTVTPFDPYCNVYLTASLREGTPSGKYKVGDVMYDFTVPAASSTTGSVLKLSDILKTKKMVLLNFWFVNCGYCEEEFPALQTAYTEYQDKVEVIAFNVPQASYQETGTMEEIKKYIQDTQSYRNPFTFPFAQNAPVGLAARFVGSYPTSVVIDAEGVVCDIFEGARTTADFEKLFAKYTAEDYLKTSAPAAAAVEAAPAQVALLPDKRGEF